MNAEMTLTRGYSLNAIVDEFMIQLGARELQDIDTPAFIRKRYNILPCFSGGAAVSRQIAEPDDKIVKFLSVLKRNDLASV